MKKKRGQGFVILCISFLCLFVLGCPEAIKLISVVSVSLDIAETHLAAGETLQLTAAVSPSDASNLAVSWTSSDAAVASVSSSGLVTAVSAGSANITVTTEDGNKTAVCAVTVVKPVVSVSIDKETADIAAGETLLLTATVSPSDASNKAVSWTSSDAAVASVSSSGLVTAVSAGSANITVTTEDGSKTAVCAVTVTPALVSVTNVALSVNTAAMETGETLQLTATVSPSDASNKAVSWTSSAPSVASVSSSGLVTGVSAGSANITVTTEDGGKTAVCAVTVTAPLIPITSVSLSTRTAAMTTGETLQLSAAVSPANANPVVLEWLTSNYNAEVENGLVTAKKAGTVKIFVRSNNYKVDECLITITDAAVPVASVTASKESITLVAGGTYQLSASVLPSNASNLNVVWSSSDEDVASVSSDGLVTAVSAGSAVITAASVDGAKKDTVAVTVEASGISVIFEGPADELIDMSAPKDVLRKSNDDVVKISVAGTWDSYEWIINSNPWTGADGSSYGYFYAYEHTPGNYEITVIVGVGKGSAYYSKSLTLRVIE